MSDDLVEQCVECGAVPHIAFVVDLPAGGSVVIVACPDHAEQLAATALDVMRGDAIPESAPT